ncbi:UDP-N-acetylmuramoyl-L-alanyl-D-glutamate--2,6-diaminopimelate ligase [Aquimarina agarilytica]|uniref:UDP-N-acetylmuramoyl-L-alanyl-D-glutamate--2, 6-diaminopimelate ligase n=1 Tax=Aquimarina agarilytica TaxID=1087449 RepID=UPI0002891E0F|nr:UDP-N-acetylmuramoyl-L-alanyl-D-glutamate--2,6-diaminopimelate ligase [Aquimarina agarilytica]
MSSLTNILYKVSIEAVMGNTHVSVNSLQFDSRLVALNDVFVAVRGVQVDGHQFIKKAIDQGALVIVCEVFPEHIVNGVTYIKVADSQVALAVMASNFYENPSSKLKLVGVTGTNGKTTVTSLLFQLFKNAGYKVGLISTVKVCIHNKEIPATHTTPDALQLQKHLANMVTAGVTYCFMEVSSHGIHQKRTLGLEFVGGVFTNLSHDHLDYHETFKEYRDVKKSFFDSLSQKAFALTNSDDKNGPIMLQNTKAKKITYALKSFADYRGNVLESSFQGLLLKINDKEFWSKLIGDFNAYNLVSVYACAEMLGLESLEILQLLSNLESVNGRFEYVVSDQKITAIVDFAHTPDALKNVLNTVNSIRTRNETLITVVGCGGDRDQLKRPIMASIAAQLSDKVIFTNDNPRFEEPQDILNAMEAGVQPQDFKKTLTIQDRKQAIKTAVSMANPNDIILIAGKGHENYQDVKGKKTAFSDMEVVQNYLKLIG